MSNLNQPEPKPVPNQMPAMWPLVIAQMQGRDAKGRTDYGTPLQPFNRRDALNDLLDELLDAAVYLKQLQFEDALLERQAIKALLTDIINTPVLSRAWGDEFCPVCEKPIMSDDGDLDKIEEIYGFDSQEFRDKLRGFCDMRCQEDRGILWQTVCELKTTNEILQRALKDAVLREIAQMELEDG